MAEARQREAPFYDIGDPAQQGRVRNNTKAWDKLSNLRSFCWAHCRRTTAVAP